MQTSLQVRTMGMPAAGLGEGATETMVYRGVYSSHEATVELS